METAPARGSANMAVDEALLRAFQRQGDLPIFRAYRWSPAAISLGRFQEIDQDIYPKTCVERGVDIVRRITGGGAIFHDHELTYSLVCGRHHLGTMTVKESFKALCSFLVQTYRDLGLNARYALDAAGDDPAIGLKTVHCFAGREPYDILVDQAKLGGNAQRRLKDIVFQHGSIPLTLDWQKQSGLFAAHALPRPDSVTALYTATGKTAADLLPSTLFTMMKDRFASCMDVQWLDQDLNPAELAEAEDLRVNKYESDGWNVRREEG